MDTEYITDPDNDPLRVIESYIKIEEHIKKRLEEKAKDSIHIVKRYMDFIGPKDSLSDKICFHLNPDRMIRYEAAKKVIEDIIIRYKNE